MFSSLFSRHFDNHHWHHGFFDPRHHWHGGFWGF